MGIFAIAGVGFVIGLTLIILLKKTSPPPPPELINFDELGGKPVFLIEQEAFKEKCLEFLGKFNLEYKHAIWANEQELEIDMRDETPVVGGKYLALCIIDPINNQVDAIKVKGFLETVKGEEASRGILITTGYFTNEALRCIEDHPVELVDVVAFVDYLKKFNIY